MNDCIFCSIIAGNIPAHKVYEDDGYLAFLDIFPASKGHTLVIPKSHHVDIHSIPAEIYGGMAAVSKKVADLLLGKLKSEGTSIFQMNREAGWQSVFHVHMHVIPRWSGDGLHKPWDIAPADQNELVEIKKLLTE
ncbi:Hit Diadenosine tetraphosphate (Ap4A) hydrolase and other HIT family hydrolases [Candidatus Nanopelagicaceae bacterium]